MVGKAKKIYITSVTCDIFTINLVDVIFHKFGTSLRAPSFTKIDGQMTEINSSGHLPKPILIS